MKTRRATLAVLAVTLAALASAVLGLVVRATPGTEAVRLRNSLIATTGTTADFEWTPATVPAGYRQEDSAAVPPDMLDFVGSAQAGRGDRPAAGSGDLAAAVRLAAALTRQPQRGEPLQGDTATMFSTIVNKGGGYCADFTQVFNAVAYAADIPVREWGMSFDGFGGDGHAFNEIFDRRLQQWVLLDVFNGFYVVDRASGRPLSALEFRSRLARQDVLATTSIIPVGPRPRLRGPGEAVAYYRRGQFGFYLWWSNDALGYDQLPGMRLLGDVSRSAQQGVAILTGVHPRLRILPLPENSRAVRALRGVRYSVLLQLAVIVLLAGAVAFQLRLLARARRD